MAVLRKVGGCAIITNSSINFIIYCFVGRSFRKQFLSTFSRRSWCNLSLESGGKLDSDTWEDGKLKYNQLIFSRKLSAFKWFSLNVAKKGLIYLSMLFWFEFMSKREKKREKLRKNNSIPFYINKSNTCINILI